MANKNIQIKDLSGNLLFPKTKGSLVFNDNNEALNAVEAGAQVNKIEKIKLNGTELTVASKEVDIVLPAAVEYEIRKAETADEGYSATYQLYAGETAVGDKINISKDMVVQSGSVQVVTTADTPVAGYQVGDKYIDLLLANTDNQHIYVLVSDLVDNVTAADNTVVVANNTVKVNLDELKKTFAAKSTTLAGYGITDAYTTTAADEKFATKATTLAGYGITDGYTQEQADGKFATKATTLAGYGIADAYTTTQVDNLIANFITYDELV